MPFSRRCIDETLQTCCKQLCFLQPGYVQTSATLLCTWKGKKRPWRPLTRSMGPCSRVVSWLLNSLKLNLWSTRWYQEEIQQVQKSSKLIFAFPHIPSCRSYFLHFEGGLLPRPPLSIEHQSQAAVLAAAAAAAAGLPIQVEFHLGNTEMSPEQINSQAF